MWVKAPNLPLEFWTLDFLKELGNRLGKTIQFDESFIYSHDRIVARILVEIDTRLCAFGERW
jgi:hypothetical protein